MKVEIVDGDLLEQKVEVIVNAWNRINPYLMAIVRRKNVRTCTFFRRIIDMGLELHYH